MLVLQDVHKVYGKSKEKQVVALQGINLSVNKGEIFGVVGFSGAGKSTLIRCVNLLERPTSGKVLINGVDLLKLSPKELREQRKKIGMIFQNYNLLHSKTIFQNVAMPLTLEGKPKDYIKKKVTELLSFVGLEERMNHYPEQLSGGQKQRVGIARALATDPDILLCDEATSALDPSTTESVLELLRRVREEFGLTILMITHEMNVIRDICDKVAVIEGGKIVEQGPVIDVFTEPQTEIARSFVRTVLNDATPESIKELIRANSGRTYRIIFKGLSTSAPLLSDTAKKFQVDLNVFHGMLTELQGIPFGNLLVNIQGDAEEIERAIQYMQEQAAIVREVTRDAL
ncbi:methionine ABC transporter ATP-binding protein [Lederbergia wuyishanensis]|uniref:D-methionine transport system ATP-binding protein n=1 Tax=Lederbergia wuyishanensis TaxID=1347903 RepID=A0ABU0D975_9BACI|nr:methionine ABC transporter ATP-binding protein [Lederbergia wuyishanensis]MCJ8009422.1 methionine ABC transporter ATP-binding protein [Lederbergia wuyishanensis]MDQ0344969.1 D-methionine transport system ATP-binding protein [Lederbergia wuyishanensis]